VLKCRSKISKRLIDALIRRTSLLTTMTIEMVGLEEIKRLYEITILRLFYLGWIFSYKLVIMHS
jgi:hypothetical protein